MWASAVSAVVGALARLASALMLWRGGLKSAEADHARKTVDAVAAVGDARDRLRRDPDYARSVRDRFTRD